MSNVTNHGKLVSWHSLASLFDHSVHISYFPWALRAVRKYAISIRSSNSLPLVVSQLQMLAHSPTLWWKASHIGEQYFWGVRYSCFFGSCWKCLHPSPKGADDNKSYLCPWLRETLVKSTSISSNGVSTQYFVPTSLKSPWQTLFCKQFILCWGQKSWVGGRWMMR